MPLESLRCKHCGAVLDENLKCQHCGTLHQKLEKNSLQILVVTPEAYNKLRWKIIEKKLKREEEERQRNWTPIELTKDEFGNPK